MKTITLKNKLTTMLLIIAGTIYGQTPTDNLIRLISLGTGSESNLLTNDDTNLNIDAAGVVTVTDLVPDFSPTQTSGITTGKVTLTDALSKSFVMRIKPISVVDQTPGANYGGITTSGGIDRSSTGDLGVRNPISGDLLNFGIDVGEGYGFGFSIPLLPPTITVQITRIYFSTFGAAETAVIVNRIDTSKSLVFPGPATGAVAIADVSSLGLYGTGGSNPYNMVTVFNNSTTTQNFRITNIEFKLLETSTLGVQDVTSNFSNKFVVSTSQFSDVISIDYNSNVSQNIDASLIDVTGRIIAKKSSKGQSVSNQIIFEGNSLKSGIYLVKISDGVNTVTKKIIKQ